MKITKDIFTAITNLGSAVFYTILVIFLLLIGKLKLGIYLALGLIIAYTFVFILRLFYFKERPKKEEYTNLFTKINASSFPSLHTMSSMYTAIVLANEIKKPIITGFFILISLLIGYSRMHLKKHYFIDVLFGLVLGIVFGILYLLII